MKRAKIYFDWKNLCIIINKFFYLVCSIVKKFFFPCVLLRLIIIIFLFHKLACFFFFFGESILAKNYIVSKISIKGVQKKISQELEID